MDIICPVFLFFPIEIIFSRISQVKDCNSPFTVHTWGHSDQTPLKAYIRLELFWVPIPRHLLSTGYFVILYYFAEPNEKAEDRHVLGHLQSFPAVYLQEFWFILIPWYGRQMAV